MARKLNKTALKLINGINEILRMKGIKDPANDLFCFGCDYLLKHNMYHGYNMYKWKDYDEYGLGGRLVLAGTSNPNEYDCLQIWTLN